MHKLVGTGLFALAPLCSARYRSNVRRSPQNKHTTILKLRNVHTLRHQGRLIEHDAAPHSFGAVDFENYVAGFFSRILKTANPPPPSWLLFICQPICGLYIQFGVSKLKHIMISQQIRGLCILGRSVCQNMGFVVSSPKGGAPMSPVIVTRQRSHQRLLITSSLTRCALRTWRSEMQNWSGCEWPSAASLFSIFGGALKGKSTRLEKVYGAAFHLRLSSGA